MKNLPRVVVLTGAGVSAESGIKTFRDSNGLWENHHVEDVATPEGFARNPALVYRFYNARRAQLHSGEVAPNAAHIALARLENVLGENLMLVTQNVDNLHERGGSKDVLHMHGELLSARCLHSEQRFAWSKSFDAGSVCPCCGQCSLRPDIVWFGEVPMYMDTIFDALSKADIFIAVGTSGQVYPAASFVQTAKEYGAHTIEVNLAPTSTNFYFDESLSGKASQTVPSLVESIIKQTESI